MKNKVINFVDKVDIDSKTEESKNFVTIKYKVLGEWIELSKKQIENLFSQYQLVKKK